jgi:pimeloyl-ACP methyl ester carboxylesterase
MIETLFSMAVTLVVIIGLVGGYFVHTTRRIARGAERAVPPRGRFIEIDGRQIHYVQSGEGRPILMIHGLGGTLHHLVRPLMEDFGDGYRLIALDRPGSGYSTRIAADHGGVKEQAAFIARFIDEMGLERPLLVGHSLGGAIALATALDYPQQVAGLALIAPLTAFESELPPEFAALYIRSPFRRRLIASTLAVPMSVRNAQKTLEFVFGPQKPPADFAVAGGALVGLRPSHFYATSTDATALERDMPALAERYGELTVPVGIIFGTADRVLDHRRHGVAMREKVADLDLELLEGSGHMPQYARTQEVAAFIRHIADRAFARIPG